MSNSPNGQDADGDGTLTQFVRNRFFNGKLLTARDMAAEQDYHADRLETITRHVTGWGIVCGLEARIQPGDGPEDPPRAVVEPGVAIEGTGRLIVVAETDSEPLSDASRSVGDVVSVYVRYSKCLTESVPAHGSEDACKDECDYNRVRETYTIEVESGVPERESGTPEEQKAIPIERVQMPTTAFFQNEDEEFVPPGPGHEGLHVPAASYHAPDEVTEDNRVRSCGQPEPDRVYLGSFRRGDEEWSFLEPDDESVPRPYVYSNDMLYAGLLDHVTDYENPHEASVSIVEGGENPSIGIDEGDVQIRGSNGIEVEGDNRTIHLSSGDSGTEVLEPLARYLGEDGFRRDALRQIACTFEDLRGQFDYVAGDLGGTTPAQEAAEIVRVVRDGLTDGGDFEQVYEEPGEFIEFVATRLESPFERFARTLPAFVGDTGEFGDARSRLETVLGDVRGGDHPNEANRLALALGRFCEAASCLSGYCVRFERFADAAVLSPLTFRDVVVQPVIRNPRQPANVPAFDTNEDDETALQFRTDTLRIVVPRTARASVSVRDAPDAFIFALFAYDGSDDVVEMGGILEDSGDLSVGSDSEPYIEYLEFVLVSADGDEDEEDFERFQEIADTEDPYSFLQEDADLQVYEEPGEAELVSICVR